MPFLFWYRLDILSIQGSLMSDVPLLVAFLLWYGLDILSIRGCAFSSFLEEFYNLYLKYRCNDYKSDI